MMERTKPSHREKAKEILEAVGMWDKRRSLAEELSYGQRKLLEIGRAMALEVDIYLFDEPFAGLFPQMLNRVKRILKRMRDEGRDHHFRLSQHGYCARDVRPHRRT